MTAYLGFEKMAHKTRLTRKRIRVSWSLVLNFQQMDHRL